MAVRIEIYAKNVDVTDRIREYVNKKVAKLDRFLGDIDEAKVDLAYVKSARSSMDRQVAQITVHGRGFVLRTEERADELLAAFDNALEKMQRQIERLKGKRHRGRGDGKSAAEVTIPAPEEEPESSVIVRRKTFDLVPMTEVDALEQMKLLGHDNFFVFYNLKTRVINVLYRRRDGTYGLIEPRVS